MHSSSILGWNKTVYQFLFTQQSPSASCVSTFTFWCVHGGFLFLFSRCSIDNYSQNWDLLTLSAAGLPSPMGYTVAYFISSQTVSHQYLWLCYIQVNQIYWLSERLVHSPLTPESNGLHLTSCIYTQQHLDFLYINLKQWTHLWASSPLVFDLFTYH